MRTTFIGTLGALVILSFFCLLGCSAALAAEAQCVSPNVMMQVIEKIPKTFPVGGKDNVYILEGTSARGLTVTVNQLRVTFFDSRGDDKSQWGSITNMAPRNALQGDLADIGCVAAGINHYTTGEVDKGDTAKAMAQEKYNEYIRLIIEGIK